MNVTPYTHEQIVDGIENGKLCVFLSEMGRGKLTPGQLADALEEYRRRRWFSRLLASIFLGRDL